MPYSDNIFDQKIKSFLKKRIFPNYLDIGTGAGKYGKMIREINPEANVVGIEPDKTYIKRFGLKRIYKKIIVRKAEEYLLKKPNFHTDICIIGDCLEHLKKSDGVDLLNFLVYRSRYIIAVFPTKFLQYSYEGHKLEAHISVWTKHDFENFNFTYEKKKFINLVIIKGYLEDIDAIGKKNYSFFDKFIMKFFKKKVFREPFK